MGPYVAVNAILAGAFGFAALHHLALWARSRREAVLLAFAIHCIICSALSLNMVWLATAQTVGEGQRALNMRMEYAILGQVTAVWVLSLCSGLRAPRYVWLISGTFLAAGFANVAISPLAGTVTGIEQMTLWRGEVVSLLHRESPSAFLIPLYALAFTIGVFGFMCAARIWRHDAIGGALLSVASAGNCLVVVASGRVDLSGAPRVYFGAIPYLGWMLLLALQIARDYRRRAELVTAAERRFRAIFDQTFQFVGLLDLDGTVLEANQTALRFANVGAEDVVGRPFWDTPWWTHSPDLQTRVRQAVQSSAAGEVVRFEATHPATNGEMRHVDFSLKPARDADGAVTLLIPEGRDITERVAAKRALEESREQLKRLADGLLVAREEERTAIAREIHDVLGQALTALKMDTVWIERRVGPVDGDATAMHEKLAGMRVLIDDTVAAIRRLASELRPGLLDDLGLAAAIEWEAQQFEHRFGIPFTLHVDIPGIDKDTLDPVLSTALFRIVQESLTNVARHSGASHVTIRLHHLDDDLVLDVHDDGVGIRAADVASPTSIGLTGMRERAQLVGGELLISGETGAGSTVRVSVPRVPGVPRREATSV